VTATRITLVRRGGAAGLAVSLVAAIGVLGAAPASAASMDYDCKILSSSIPWSGNASATSPSGAKAGQTATTTVTLPDYKNGPVPVQKNSVQTVITLSINGQTQTVKGGTNPSNLAPNQSFPIAPIKVQFKAKSGDNTIVLTKVEFDYQPTKPNVGPDTTCTGNKPELASFTVAAAAQPQGPAQPQAPAQPVAQQPDTNAAPTAGGTPNNLAKTGPEDAMRTLLIALAVLQVGLIAAVRWGRRTAPATSGRRR
jgi:hypothetical protein